MHTDEHSDIVRIAGRSLRVKYRARNGFHIEWNRSSTRACVMDGDTPLAVIAAGKNCLFHPAAGIIFETEERDPEIHHHLRSVNGAEIQPGALKIVETRVSA